MKKLVIVLSSSLFLLSATTQASFRASARILKGLDYKKGFDYTAKQVTTDIAYRQESPCLNEIFKPNPVLQEASKAAIANNLKKANNLWCLGLLLQREFPSHPDYKKMNAIILAADDNTLKYLADTTRECSGKNSLPSYNSTLHRWLIDEMEKQNNLTK